MAKIQKLVEIGKTEQGVCWPKMTRTQDVPVHVQGVPVHVTKNVQNVYFSPIFPYF